MSRIFEEDVKTQTSVIEKWLRGEELKRKPSNGVVPTAQRSLFNPLRRGNDDRVTRVSPVELSPSSSSSNGFATYFSDQAYSPPNTMPGGFHNAADDLSMIFNRLTIGCNHSNNNNRPEQRAFPVDSDNMVGFGSTFNRNFESPGLYEGFNGSDGDIVRSTWLSLGQGFSYDCMGDSRDSISSPLTYKSFGSRNSSPTFANTTPTNNTNSQMGYYNYFGEVQFENPFAAPLIGDDLVWSQQNSNGLGGTLNSPQFWEQQRQNLAPDMNSPLHDRSVIRGRTRMSPPGGVSPVFRYNQALGPYEAFGGEDSFIIEEKSLSSEPRGYGVNFPCNGFESHNARKGSFNGLGTYRKGGVADNAVNGMSLGQILVLAEFRDMATREGAVYLMAKDQSGCRKLQKVFDEGTSDDVQLIFEAVINHIVELSTNPFGNYLVQKLLDVCTREQKTQIVFVMTKDPGELKDISLNVHGTRVVQKLIETSKDWLCISSLIMALKPNILHLIMDLNGNHVLQSCLKCLRSEETEFIFEAATRFCFDIAIHQHGCCVMQKCIERSTGHYRLNLLAEISKHALHLAQNEYGNYVIQFIMDQKIQSVTALVISHFKGHYVSLSRDKCASHVVEKCLREVPESRQRIVQELLTAAQFVDLLQHPFANYVIQSALNFTRGSILHDLLVRGIRPYSQTLRASPYCKKILSQIMPRR